MDDLTNIFDKLDEHFNTQIKPNLSKNMRQILKKYTDDGNDDLVDYFFKRRVFSDKESVIIRSDIMHLRGSIKLSRIPFPLTVYRGTSKSFIGYSRMIETKNFYSTSLSQNVAAAFAENYGRDGLIIEISLPSGYPALWMGPMSLYPMEVELLLLNDTKLKILEYNTYNSVFEKVIAKPIL